MPIFPHHHHHHHHHGAVPVGTVCAYLGVIDFTDLDVPQNQRAAQIERHGWLPCAGQTLSIVKYLELYAAIGTLYNDANVADGMFKLPDCRGTFLRGVDGGANRDPEAGKREGPDGAGAVKGGVGSTQSHAIMKHSHDYDTYKVVEGPADGAPVDVLGVAGHERTKGTFAEDSDHYEHVSDNETRPVNIAVNFIIRAL
jgi:microcystin-dependent protein